MARTALLAGRGGVRLARPPAHAEIVPSSVAQMNAAGSFVPGTRNAVIGFVVGFHTMPVGAAGVGFGGFWGLTLTQAVAGGLGCGALEGSGILTCNETMLPSPL